MRILTGGPARETESELFRLHVEGLEAQASDPLDGFDTGPHFGVTIRHEVVPDDDGPRWHQEKIERVAKVRQEFLEGPGPPVLRVPRGVGVALHDMEPGQVVSADDPLPVSYTEADYDALLLVDTDVILGPGVLERMWAVDADVVYGVFFTEADWGSVPGVTCYPQVWDRHAYQFTRATWDALHAPGVNEVPVLGGGACTLIRGRGFESRYWPLLKSISHLGGMFVGEDRTFALGLETRGIAQIAVTGLPIVHCHTPELQTPEALENTRKEVGL